MVASKKNQLPQPVLTAQELIGVDEINAGILYTRDKMIYAYIRVRGMGDSLLSEQERQSACERFTRELEKEKKAWQLLSIPRVLNTQAMINYLMQLKKRTPNNARLALLDGEIDAIQEMAESGTKESMIVIKLWEKENRDGEKTLLKRVSEMIDNIRSISGIEAERLDNQDISFLCKQFAELGAPQDNEDATAELPVLAGKRKMMVDTDLLNEITPFGGISFSLNKITLGSTVARAYAVSGYPRELGYSWATDIMNNSEAVTSITFDPANPHLLGEALSRSIRSTATDAVSERNVRKSKQLARQASDADIMLDELDANNEVIGQMCIVTMPFSTSDEGLEDVCKHTLSLFQTHKLKLKVLGRLQKEGLMCVMPYHTVPKMINQSFMRLMPLYTLAGGSPMAVNTYQDENGVYFAKTSTGNIVSLDLWYRGKDRTNTNIYILGKPGTGKSTLVKHIMQIEFMKGTKILVIDPESEYKDITLYLGGEVFYAGGGNAKINMLQVRSSPDDDEGEAADRRLYKDVAQKGSVLAMHLKNNDSIFRSYLPDASEMEFAMLEKTCIDLYKKYGIEWYTDCSNIPADKFPIMSDLYQYIEAQSAGNDTLRQLLGRLHSAARGSDQFVFNGHTNINLDAPVMCFDTNSLQSQTDNVKRAQYMNILGLAWEITSRDRDERVMLICDEGYIMVDRKLPQSLMLLRNFGKRCRKVNGALSFITHSVIDLLDDSIRQYGQSILDNATYKFFLGADGKNLQEITELYSLTERQQKILRDGNRGETLAMLGSTMMHLNIFLPQYKLDNMGKAGGE